jgi:hypothetical protein
LLAGWTLALPITAGLQGLNAVITGRGPANGLHAIALAIATAALAIVAAGRGIVDGAEAAVVYGAVTVVVQSIAGLG